MKKRTLLIYPSILLALSSLQMVFAFRTNAYFSIDDFRVLAYFKNHGVFQMVFDFLTHGDMFHYRKIVGFAIFGTLFKNFGVNPNPYIITMFLIQTVNVVLLFLIIRYLTKKDFASFFLTVIFNGFYLFYFSNMHEIAGAFFVLLAICLFFKYPQKIYLSCISFILALFSKELTYSLPFFLLAISYIEKKDLKKVIPFFVILFLYAIYQSFFVFILKDRSFVSAYGVTLSLSNFGEMILFYLSPLLIALLVLPPILKRNYKPLLILGVFFITLMPVLFFGARREAYYIYIPAIYLLIYLSMYLPKLNLKTGVIYLIILLIFGGRSVFPKIARQVFPNWQEVSINNVVNEVEKSVSDSPRTVTIGLRRITLERDAGLVLENGVLDLFVSKGVSGKYNFIYDQSTNSVIATQKQ